MGHRGGGGGGGNGGGPKEWGDDEGGYGGKLTNQGGNCVWCQSVVIKSRIRGWTHTVEGGAH